MDTRFKSTIVQLYATGARAYIRASCEQRGMSWIVSAQKRVTAFRQLKGVGNYERRNVEMCRYFELEEALIFRFGISQQPVAGEPKGRS